MDSKKIKIVVDYIYLLKYSHYSSYSLQKVAGNFFRYQNWIVIQGLEVDPSHLLLLIEPLGTSFDWRVLGACGSIAGLGRMVYEKIYFSCVGAIITRCMTAVWMALRLTVFQSCSTLFAWKKHI